MAPDRGVEALAHWVPHNGRGRVAFPGGVARQRRLDDLGAVAQGGDLPGQTTISGVEEAVDAGGVCGGVDDGCVCRLRERGDDKTGGGGAPGKAREALAREGVVAGDAVMRAGDERPGESVVWGAQQAGAIVRVQRVVGITCACEDDAGAAGLHADGTDAERGDGGSAIEDGQRVCERREGDAGGWPGGIHALPHASAGGSDVDGVAGGVRRINRDAGDASSEASIGEAGDLRRTDRLPGGVETNLRLECLRREGACRHDAARGGWGAGRLAASQKELDPLLRRQRQRRQQKQREHPVPVCAWPCRE